MLYQRPSLGSSPALGVHFRMGADTLLPQPLTHDRGLCAASPSGKCRGLRKVPGTDSVPGTWTGALHRIGKTAVFILPPR